MKKILILLGSILLLLILVLAFAPILFKDKINTLVREQANAALNAKVDFADLELSFLRNFPNARIGLEDYSVVNLAPFEGDTLVKGKNFDLVVNLMSIVSGDAIELKKIILVEPQVSVKVLEDGTANYDIAPPAEENSDPEASNSAETGSFQLTLNEYRIENAHIHYDDALYATVATLHNLTHSGNGDFTAVNYDLRTQSSIEALTVIYDGIRYLDHARLDAMMNMNIDTQSDMLVQLRENSFQLNELAFTVDGLVRMPLGSDDIGLDLSYQAAQTAFRNLLSLVPGVYTAEFGDLKTQGEIDFHGTVKGVYNEQQLPGVDITLGVKEGLVQYPDLPTPIEHINLDMQVQVPEADLENTFVNLKNFHADLGNNPIQASFSMRGLERMQIDADVKARLNLAELTQMVPIEGTELKGIFTLDAKAHGVYDSTRHQFPQVEAQMHLNQGYAKNQEYPVTVGDIEVDALLSSKSSNIEEVHLEVSRFLFELDGEPIQGNAKVDNFEDPRYLINANGRLDLEKLMKIYPIDSMTLRGKLVIDDFSTQGRMSDIEAERYTKLPTRGKVRVQGLYYSDYELPAAFTLDQGEASFTPDKLVISQASGKLGTSDYAFSGYLSNYMAYALTENAPLKGEMRMRSTKLDLNEWMVEEETSSTRETETGDAPAEEIGVVPIPENISLAIDADAAKILYSNLALDDFQGRLRIADQRLSIEQADFGLLGGQVKMKGSYDTKDIKNPRYDFDLAVNQLGAKEAFQSFEMVQGYLPVAQHVVGKMNTQFSISGRLKEDMSPILEDINSDGLFQLLNGSLENLPLLEQIIEKTKIKELSPLSLKDLDGQFSIKDGFINIKPFKIKHQDMVMTVGGRQNITGQLDYDIDLDMPAGKLGQSTYQALGSLTGGLFEPKNQDRVQFALKVGGDAKNPVISGVKPKLGDSVKDNLKDKLKDKLGLGSQSDSTQAASDSTNTAGQDSTKGMLKGLEKDLKNEVEDKAKSTLDSLKKLFPFPKKRKKND